MLHETHKQETQTGSSKQQLLERHNWMLTALPTGDQALRELPSPGKSGSVFFLSHDDRFIIKTMRKVVCQQHGPFIFCCFISSQLCSQPASRFSRLCMLTFNCHIAVVLLRITVLSWIAQVSLTAWWCDTRITITLPKFKPSYSVAQASSSGWKRHSNAQHSQH